MITTPIAPPVVENRQCSRYQLRLPALFSWTDKVRHHGAGFTRDIGVSGVFLYSQTCPTLGTTVKVELVLPLSKETGREITLRCIGIVIRLEADLPYGQGGFAIAGDFGNYDYPRLANA